jgi:hypothetical protein
VISHQRTDGNVFVDIRPMNTNPFADQSPVLTLGRWLCASAGTIRPGGNLASVGKDEMQGSIVDLHIDCMWVKLDCQSTHATSPRKTWCSITSARTRVNS